MTPETTKRSVGLFLHTVDHELDDWSVGTPIRGIPHASESHPGPHDGDPTMPNSSNYPRAAAEGARLRIRTSSARRMQKTSTNCTMGIASRSRWCSRNRHGAAGVHGQEG